MDLTVEAHDGIHLAVRDHGGPGRAVVLMHGAGTHLLSLEGLVRGLAAYRVVTMDQRWSGQSGDSETYSWDDLVRDMESVVNALDLGNPAVGGHSWGGMIALHYGAAHPDAPAVFNLDGHGLGDPSLYDGMTESEARRAIAALEGVEGGHSRPQDGDDRWKETAWAKARQVALALGIPEAEADAYTDRSFVAREPGRWYQRPGAPLFEGLRGDQKMFDLYRRLTLPALVVLSTAPPAGLPVEVTGVLDAYYRGLRRAFDEVGSQRSNLRVLDLPGADHMSLAGRHAPETAAAVTGFLSDVGYAP